MAVLLDGGFFGRKQELGFFLGRLERLEKGELIVLYGRRRLGKTLLAKKVMDKWRGGGSFYFFVNLLEEGELKAAFSQAVLEQSGDSLKIVSWKDFFVFLSAKAGVGKKVLVVLDEFQRLKAVAPSFITQLQDAWDSKLKHCGIMIVLVGSSVGMMKRIALSGSGALYGRKTAQMRLEPFSYSDFREVFSDLGEEKRVEWFSVFGGTPYYVELARGHKNLFEAVEAEVFAGNAPLREEPKNLLEFELRAIARHNSILHAIASGKQSVKEISDLTGISSESLPAYFSSLIGLLGLVEREEPLFGKKNAGRYVLKDNFFQFWYRFVLPQASVLELGQSGKALEFMKQDFPSFVGKAFEGVVFDLFKLYNGKKIGGLQLDFQRIGRWWDRKGNEIDLVIANGAEIVLGEVKWTNKPMERGILEALMEKSRLVEQGGQRRFVLVSKSGFTFSCVELAKETNALLLDLKDISELFDNAPRQI